MSTISQQERISRIDEFRAEFRRAGREFDLDFARVTWKRGEEPPGLDVPYDRPHLYVDPLGSRHVLDVDRDFIRAVQRDFGDCGTSAGDIVEDDSGDAYYYGVFLGKAAPGQYEAPFTLDDSVRDRYFRLAKEALLFLDDCEGNKALTRATDSAGLVAPDFDFLLADLVFRASKVTQKYWAVWDGDLGSSGIFRSREDIAGYSKRYYLNRSNTVSPEQYLAGESPAAIIQVHYLSDLFSATDGALRELDWGELAKAAEIVKEEPVAGEMGVEQGVSIYDVAFAAIQDEEVAKATVKNLVNSKKMEARPIGKCPIDGRKKLYRMDSLLSDYKKFTGINASQIARINKEISPRLRSPTK